MKCKPGDLAIAVRSFSGREGVIVEVMEFVGTDTTCNGGLVHDAWLVKYRGSDRHPDTGRRLLARDQDLMPLPGASDLVEGREALKSDA